MDPLAVEAPVYSPRERLTLDARPAEAFFATPRIGVAHTDAAFTRRLTALYRRALAPLAGGGTALLELCSGWDSHLPPDVRLGEVIGHGVNSEELEANGALTARFTQDLNARTRLPLPDGRVGAVLCCNGIQYLTRPEWVLAEVRRVLAPGGVAVLAFSGNCWAERAATGWLGRNAAGRLELAARLVQGAGLTLAHTESVVSEQAGVDSFFAVVAQKPPAVDVSTLTVELDPVATARAFIGPALQELDLGPAQATQLTLERWRDSYRALMEDAVDMGMPRSAVPTLPVDAGPEEIRAARDHLRAMMESFLSAGL